jgi:hypothetical protein
MCHQIAPNGIERQGMRQQGHLGPGASNKGATLTLNAVPVVLHLQIMLWSRINGSSAEYRGETGPDADGALRRIMDYGQDH